MKHGVCMGWVVGIILAWTAHPVLGQPAREDVVYLRNGEVIFGQIIAQVPDESVTIQLIGGSRLIYTQAEIERIAQAPARYEAVTFKVPMSWRGFRFQARGWSHRLHVGLGLFQQRWGPAVRPGISYGLVYQFRPGFAAGLGTGLERYAGGWVVPTVVEASGEFWRRRRWGAFWLGQAGYGWGVRPNWPLHTFQGQALYHAGLGMRCYTTTRFSWGLTFGYKALHAYEEAAFGDIVGMPIIIIRERTYRATQVGLFVWF